MQLCCASLDFPSGADGEASLLTGHVTGSHSDGVSQNTNSGQEEPSEWWGCSRQKPERITKGQT